MSQHARGSDVAIRERMRCGCAARVSAGASPRVGRACPPILASWRKFARWASRATSCAGVGCERWALRLDRCAGLARGARLVGFVFIVGCHRDSPFSTRRYMLSSLFSLCFSRRFEVFVGLMRYCLKRKGDPPQRGIDECQRFLNIGQVEVDR
jgi:hypothetical protein